MCIRDSCNGDKYLRIHPVNMQQAWIRHVNHELPADYVPLPTCTDSDSFDHLNIETPLLASGARVRLEKIPSTMLSKVEVFYVCANCGKIYWEGGHYEKVHEKFSYILSRNSNS